MNSLQVSCETGVFIPQTYDVRVATRIGLVYIKIDDKVLEMNTVSAVDTGMALAKFAGQIAPDEYIKLKLNGESFDLLAENALQIGGALLRKADDADDYQLRINK